MNALVQYIPQALRSQFALARLYTSALSLFALQGIILLVLYWTKGSGTQPEDLPPGLQLDFLHSWVHLAIGLAAVYVTFRRPSLSISFVQLFGLVYLFLAALGTFTTVHLGMQLERSENLLHWTLGLVAAVIGFGLRFVPSMRSN